MFHVEHSGVTFPGVSRETLDERADPVERVAVAIRFPGSTANTHNIPFQAP